LFSDAAPRKIVPALAWYRPFEPFALALIRASLGIDFIAHGVDRLLLSGPRRDLGPVLGHIASSVGAFELVGGVLLVVGLATRPIALLFAIEWILISAAVPIKPGTSWLMLGATPHFPVFVAALCLLFAVRGGGRYSVDANLGKEI
jgi:putative oxidoreductase